MPGPRTVLYLHSSSGLYGADRQLLALATGLDPARYRPLVVLPDRGPLVDALRAAGVAVQVRSLAVLQRAGIARMTGAFAADAAGLGRLARKHGVALVHSNTSVTLGGAAAARVAGVPHVWHVREIYERRPPAHRRLLQTADALVCVSRATAAQLDGVSTARVIYDGQTAPARGVATAAARAALGLPVDAEVVAVVGRINGWKGQDVLIRALAAPALRDRSPTIAAIVGAPSREDDRALPELEQLAARLGVADRVRHLGFRRDLENVYGAADLVVVPSTRPDPLPSAAIEAAARGRCVVASAHGGLPEIIRDGATGVLVAPDDPAALGDHVRALLDDPTRRAVLGAAAAGDVARRFSRSRMLGEVQRLYDELPTR